jgi:hypothetical protein
MDEYKGVFEIEVLGKKRGFKFGMGAFAHLCRLENCSIGEATNLIIQGDLQAQLGLLYTAAVQYARIHKEQDPTQEQVNDWVDHIGLDKFIGAISSAFRTSPNAEAPKEEKKTEGQS